LPALAFAEIQKAEYFITCDDDVVRLSRRIALRVKVANPVKFVEDLNI
jgi:predicted nucleic acid-binding protein